MKRKFAFALLIILTMTHNSLKAQEEITTKDTVAFSPQLLAKAKEMHSRFLSVDTHCDTPLNFVREKNYDVGKANRNQVTLIKMQKGMLDGAFMACFVDQGPRTKVSSDSAVQVINKLIDAVYKQVDMNSDRCAIAYTPADLEQLKAEGKKAFFIGVENGYGIGKDIENLERLKKLKVSYLTLCHVMDNDICDSSSKSKDEWGGLSPFGEKVVEEMNRLGMIIDVSHASESTFWDVIKLSSKPIIASHSGVKGIFNHNRNLTDAQLKALAKQGGVVQIYFVGSFMSPKRRETTLYEVLDHIDYAVRVAGIDHVGIGTDFDGGSGVIGCKHAGQLLNLTAGLIERGYTEEEIAKIWGGNFLRVMKEVQNVE
ncbi:membrane dipeptidase [Bacteroides sp. 214]|uniref:dipeptidase n=1 Tax=Bacteroides sp. 214 TaxID=2302935 RepID=UPI0013D5D38B|nr:dipeptidase [Bacteroides sp. 214]NDW11280.1 membrane dipeptidase [Bacteroides sp. 214]